MMVYEKLTGKEIVMKNNNQGNAQDGSDYLAVQDLDEKD